MYLYLFCDKGAINEPVITRKSSCTPLSSVYRYGFVMGKAMKSI